MAHLKVETNKLVIQVVEARDLPAADLNGKSDPYVVIKNVTGLHMHDKSNVKTKVISKTLTPVWNESFQFDFNYKLAKLVFKVYDKDQFGSDDLLGKCKVPADVLLSGNEFDFWFPLHHDNKKKGELHLKLRAQFAFPIMNRGVWFPVLESSIVVGLGWDVSKKKTIDLDASVIGLDSNYQIVDYVSYSHLKGFGGAVVHSGDNRTGEGKGDDEEISIQLTAVPPHVHVLIVTVNSFGGIEFSNIKSAYVRLREKDGKFSTLGFYRLSKLAEKTGLFFGALIRNGPGWNFRAEAWPCDGRVYSDSLPHIVNYIRNPSFS